MSVNYLMTKMHIIVFVLRNDWKNLKQDNVRREILRVMMDFAGACQRRKSVDGWARVISMLYG